MLQDMADRAGTRMAGFEHRLKTRSSTLRKIRSKLLEEPGLKVSEVVIDDADVDAVVRDWTVLTAGVVSQQMANAPGEPLATGRFTAALPDLVAMFARHYGTDSDTETNTPTSTPRPKEARRVRNR